MAAWRGRLFLDESVLMYCGPVAPTQTHRHHALQVVLSLGGPIPLSNGPVGQVVETDVAVIGPDVDHRIVGGSRAALVLYFDADEPMWKRLQQPGTNDDGPETWAMAGRRLREVVPNSLPRAWPDVELAVARVVAELGCSSVRVSSRHRAVAGARRYIAENLGGDLRAGTVAAAVGLSASRLAQVFASDIGLPLRRYVRWTRIRAAAQAVQQGQTLTEAAATAGFADSAHLSRTFREMFGIAPSDVTAVAEWIVR